MKQNHYLFQNLLLALFYSSCIFTNEKADIRVYKIEKTTKFNDSLDVAYITFQNGIQKMFVLNTVEKKKPLGGSPDLSRFTTKKHISNDSNYFVFEYSSAKHRDSVHEVRVDKAGNFISNWYTPNQLIPHERILLNYGGVYLLGLDTMMSLDGVSNLKSSYDDLFGLNISPVREAFISNDSLRVYTKNANGDSVCMYVLFKGNTMNLCTEYDDPTFDESGFVLWGNVLVYVKFEGGTLINYRYSFNFENQTVSKNKDTTEIDIVYSISSEINYGDSVIYTLNDFEYP